MRKALAALAVGVGLAFGAPNAAEAQDQVGLVNVSIGDVTILENVQLAVAANLVAVICGVNVELITVDSDNDFVCQAGYGRSGGRGGGQTITIEQVIAD
jgi:hypothetical protein